LALGLLLLLGRLLLLGLGLQPLGLVVHLVLLFVALSLKTQAGLGVQ
jgi:hypothetical protein